MKRLFISTLFVLAGLTAEAQENIPLDSLRFVLPEFCQGTVRFADNQLRGGMLNISPIDQAVYSLSDGKDTLYVAEHPEITSVSVAGKFFVGWSGRLVEVIASDDDKGVGILRTTTKINNVKTGAYGGVSSTSSSRSYSIDAISGSYSSLIIDDPRNYVYSKTTYLLNKGKFIPVSKKSFEKLFPGQKDYIESIWPSLDVQDSNPDSVLKFYKELLAKE